MYTVVLKDTDLGTLKEAVIDTRYYEGKAEAMAGLIQWATLITGNQSLALRPPRRKAPMRYIS